MVQPIAVGEIEVYALLNNSETRVYSDPSAITQTSTRSPTSVYAATAAIDQNYTTWSETRGGISDALCLNFQETLPITKVVVYNRYDAANRSKMVGARVVLKNTANAQVWAKTIQTTSWRYAFFPGSTPSD